MPETTLPFVEPQLTDCTGFRPLHAPGRQGASGRKLRLFRCNRAVIATVAIGRAGGVEISDEASLMDKGRQWC